jgi:hypothetical protein
MGEGKIVHGHIHLKIDEGLAMYHRYICGAVSRPFAFQS